MSDYPEHDKRSAILPQSQAIGEFLDWLSTQGVHLMVWRTFREPKTCTCVFADAPTGQRLDHRTGQCYPCSDCNGTGLLEETYGVQQWTDWGGTIEEKLARYFDIDLGRIERERRAMLETLRTGT